MTANKVIPWVAAALIAGASPATAGGSGEGEPKAHLRYRGERIQRAHILASCWPAEDGGQGCSEANPMTWPRADGVRAGRGLRLRIRSREKPRRVFVDSYRSVGRKGRPKGRGKDIRTWKRPVRRDGKTVAWNVIFKLRAAREHYVKVLVDVPHTVAYGVHVRVRD